MSTKTTFQLKAEIIYNKRVKDVYWHCLLNAPALAREAHAGQFVQIRLSDSLEPFLRRPFSIHRARGGEVEILYQVLGRGTEVFAKKKAGEYLDLIGPLGNGFELLPGRLKPNPLIIAGGMGVAPLLFLAEKLAYSIERRAYRKDKGFELSAKRYPLNAIVLIGAKTKDQILCEKDFIDSGYSVKIATDDGSRGFKGYVSDLLKKELSTIDHRPSTIYACGPKPMLKEVAALSKKYKIPAQLSLEEHMACGIGACLGCTVNTKTGFKRVCKEGPVFGAPELIWSNETQA